MPVASEKKILVVDDEPALLGVIMDILILDGFAVLGANSMAEALNVLRTEEIGAVISDIAMPNGTGLELLEQVRAIPMNIPFVFLTAFDTKEHLLGAMRLGAIDLIEKPFSQKRILEVAARALEIGARILDSEQEVANSNVKHISQNNKFINLLKIENSRKSK